MRIVCISSLEELAPYADAWDRLAGGIPFRSWTWLSCWWRHYGPQQAGEVQRQRLAVLCAFDAAEHLVGVAPWYLDSSAWRGRALRPLGSGEVCSDYLGVLCEPHQESAVVEAVADFLLTQTRATAADALRWDVLDLPCVERADGGVTALASALSQAGCRLHARPDLSYWRLPLPTTWDAYVMSLSKKLRRDVRRLERDVLATPRARLHTAECMADLDRALKILMDLHQRRHESLGERGCFAAQRFRAFHQEVAPQLLRQGQVEFCWFELDGKPVAAEYQLVGNGVLYAYQAGVEPAALDAQPGKLIYLAILRRAIERGYRAFDFLRGDEPYKARFGAQRQPTVAYRLAPPHTAAQLRDGLWRAGDSLKHWLKRGLGRDNPSGVANPLCVGAAAPTSDS